MSEPDDHQLLARFARENSESAFALLVQRYVNLVYSAARRHAGSDDAAGEITQAVFIILARKAADLSPRTVLSGWLWQTTRLTAANHLRAESRRVRREQEAFMQSQIDEPQSDPTWQAIAPLLDEALDKLGGRDRDAVVLRFFENKNLREVGHALGASEDAAKMRVNRALEKLRKIFSKRGITLSTAFLAAAVSANSVQAAPVGLAKTISIVAVAKGAAAGTSTLTLVKGALKIMAWTKAKSVVVATVGVLLAAGTTTAIVEKVSHPKPSASNLAWAEDPKYWITDSRVLGKVPPAMILRPTKFAIGGGSVSAGNRMMYKNSSVKDLVDTAYGFASTRTVFPQDMPGGAYDLMYTLPAPASPVLRQEMKERFGYVAHKEVRPADVLLLKVVNPHPPTLKRAQNVSGTFMTSGGDKTVIGNQEISALCWYVEGLVNQPVLDRTGLKGTYDVTLVTPWKWNRPSREALGRALLDQLGLELVPSREPIEMLVVEKSTN